MGCGNGLVCISEASSAMNKFMLNASLIIFIAIISVCGYLVFNELINSGTFLYCGATINDCYSNPFNGLGQISFWRTVAIFAFVQCIFFLPTLIAININHSQKMSIFVINFFLGWTFIGYVASFLWSVYQPKFKHL